MTFGKNKGEIRKKEKKEEWRLERKNSFLPNKINEILNQNRTIITVNFNLIKFSGRRWEQLFFCIWKRAAAFATDGAWDRFEVCLFL